MLSSRGPPDPAAGLYGGQRPASYPVRVQCEATDCGAALEVCEPPVLLAKFVRCPDSCCNHKLAVCRRHTAAQCRFLQPNRLPVLLCRSPCHLIRCWASQPPCAAAAVAGAHAKRCFQWRCQRPQCTCYYGNLLSCCLHAHLPGATVREACLSPHMFALSLAAAQLQGRQQATLLTSMSHAAGSSEAAPAHRQGWSTAGCCCAGCCLST